VGCGEFGLRQCRSDGGGCETEGGIEEAEQALKADGRFEEAGKSDGYGILFLYNCSKICLLADHQSLEVVIRVSVSVSVRHAKDHLLSCFP